MDKLHRHSKAVFGLLDTYESESQQKYQQFVTNLNQFVSSVTDPAVVDRTPHRTKKKHKHQLLPTNSPSYPRDSTASTASSTASVAAVAAAAASSAANISHALDASVAVATPAPPPLAARPSRQAASRALQNLKEPTLNAKMRNEAVVKLERISIHQNVVAKPAAAASKAMAVGGNADCENDANAANRCPASPTTDLDLSAAAERLTLAESPPSPRLAAAPAAVSVPPPAPMDESLIVMPTKETEIVSLTDDDEPAAAVAAPAVTQQPDATAMMPPPAAKPVAAARKQRTAKNKPASAVVVKAEKLSLAATASDLADSSAGSQRSTRSKKPKGGAVPAPIVEVITRVKAEPMVVELVAENIPVTAPVVGNTTLESVYEDARVEQPSPIVAIAQAVAQPTHANEVEMQSVPVGGILPPPSIAQPADVDDVPMDSTYVQPAAQADATFACSANATYVAPTAAAANDQTYAAGAGGAVGALQNETICLGAAPSTTTMAATTTANTEEEEQHMATPPRAFAAMPAVAGVRQTPSMASIMTDDASDDEMPLAQINRPAAAPPASAIGGKQHKELFNPCVQSPLKQKVAAFERHTAQMDTASPAPVRQTRTKTRLRTQDSGDTTTTAPSGTIPAPIIIKTEGIVQKAHRSLLKAPSTPNLAWKSQVPVPSTPSQLQPAHSTISLPGYGTTGSSASVQAPRRLPGSLAVAAAAASASGASSTSKLAHISRPASASAATRSATSSASRETSAEDVRRGQQELADEKRRKREEKLRQVQLQREQRDKERADKYAKLVAEKEEKARAEAERKRVLKERKDREAESKRALEEIQRNLKQQAMRDAEKARTERELIEAERKEREQLDLQRIQAQKAALKAELKHNQAQKLATNKATSSHSKYRFEDLHTDDSTDDEAKMKKKNRAPPDWSLKGNREERIASQSHLSLAVVDGFFDSRPMNIDLREIFPDIQDHYLRRNSSAIWSTPPRYSTMEVPRY